MERIVKLASTFLNARWTGQNKEASGNALGKFPLNQPDASGGSEGDGAKLEEVAYTSSISDSRRPERPRKKAKLMAANSRQRQADEVGGRTGSMSLTERSPLELVQQALAGLMERTENVQTCRSQVQQLCELVQHGGNAVEFVRQGGIKLVLQTMQEHLGDPEIQGQGLQILRRLDWFKCESDDAKAELPNASKHLLSRRQYHSGWDAVWKHQDCLKMKRVAIEALSNLLRGDEMLREICEAGGIETVLLALRYLKTIRRDLRAGLELLASLSQEEVVRRRVREAGGVKEVVAAMQEHRADTYVQQAALKALTFFSLEEEGRMEVRGAGGIKAVVTCILEHWRFAQIREAGLWILINNSKEEEGRMEIRAGGGVEVAVAALETSLLNEDVLDGLTLLSCLANDEKSRAAGGVEAVVGAMREYVGNKKVQEAALGLLVAKWPKQQCLEAILAAGGVEAALAGMRASNLEGPETEQRILLLETLAKKEEGRKAIRAGGGVKMLISLMTKYQRDDSKETFFDRVQCLLEKLAEEEEGRKAIRAGGGVKMLISLMTKYQRGDSKETFFDRVLCLLEKLAEEEEGRKAIRAGGGVKMLISHMTKYQRDDSKGTFFDRVQCLLEKLAEEEEGRKAIRAAGGVQMLISHMRKYQRGYSKETFFDRVQCLLEKLAEEEEGRKAIRAAGAVEFVHDRLKHETSYYPSPLLPKLFMLLGCLTTSRKPQRAGEIETILDVMREHRNNVKVQQAGLKFLTFKFVRMEKAARYNNRTGREYSTIVWIQERSKVQAAGGIEITMAALQEHRDCHKVQQDGMKMLTWIAKGREGRREIRKAGGIELALVVIQQQGHNDSCCSTKAGPDLLAENSEEEEERICSIKAGFKLLTTLSEEKEGRRAIGAAGGIELALARIQLHKHISNVFAKGMKLLAKLSQEEECWRAIQAAGGIKIALDVLQEQAGNVLAVTQKVLALLIKLSEEEERRKHCLAAGAVEVALSLLDLSSNHETALMIFVCWIETEAEKRSPGLQQSAMDLEISDYPSEIELKNLTEVMKAAMQMHESDRRVQRAGVSQLADIARHYVGSSVVRRAGGVKITLAVMREHRKDVHVQANGLCVLARIFREHEDGLREIMTGGGVELLLAALQMFWSDEVMYRNALRFLSSLAKVVKEELREAGSVEVVLSVLSSLVRTEDTRIGWVSPECIEDILSLLNEFAADETHGAPGRFEAIVGVMRKYRHEQHVQEAGLALLLRERSSTELLETLEAGGVEVAIEGMREHADDHWLQAAGLNLLEYFSWYERQSEIRAGGGVKAVLTVMQKYKAGWHKQRVVLERLKCYPWTWEEEEVHKLCLEVLERMSGEEEGRKEIRAAGGVEAVAAVMQKYKDDIDIQLVSLQLLERISDKESLSELWTEETVKTVVAVMHKSGQHNERAQAVELLAGLAQEKKGRRKIQTAGGVEAVIACMLKKKKSVTFQTFALKLLAHISEEEEGRQAIRAAGGVEAAVTAIHQQAWIPRSSSCFI